MRVLAGTTVFQGDAQLRPAPVDAAAHGTKLDPEGAGDLLIRQALDVTQDDRRAVLGRERREGLLHVAVEMTGVEGLGRRRFVAAQPSGGLFPQALEPDPLLAPG